MPADGKKGEVSLQGRMRHEKLKPCGSGGRSLSLISLRVDVGGGGWEGGCTVVCVLYLVGLVARAAGGVGGGDGGKGAMCVVGDSLELALQGWQWGGVRGRGWGGGLSWITVCAWLIGWEMV